MEGGFDSTLKSPEVSAVPTELISAFMLPKIASRSKSAIIEIPKKEQERTRKKEGRTRKEGSARCSKSLFNSSSFSSHN
jgi:hypothetical protein